jgi:hypothetical protein
MYNIAKLIADNTLSVFNLITELIPQLLALLKKLI